MTTSSFGRKMRVLIDVYYAHMLEYRAEIILWMLAGALPLILMGLWIHVAQGQPIGGMGPVDFARYFFAVFLVRQLTVAWVIWEFEQQVVEGTLSHQLLQPADPVLRHIAMHTAERLTRLPILALFVGLFCLAYPSAMWWPGWASLAWFFVLVNVAFALRFTIQYTFAMGSFWVERAAALEQLWFLLYLFFSGLIAPLELYPEPVRSVILWTPFPYLIYVPARVLVGDTSAALHGTLIMSGWFVAFLVLNRFLWRSGLRRYSGMGA